MKSRGLRCSESTNKYLDHATGRLYAEKIFGPKEREHVSVSEVGNITFHETVRSVTMARSVFDV